MKKLISILLFSLLMICLCSCGSTNSPQAEETKTLSEEEVLSVTSEISKDLENKYPGSRVLYRINGTKAKILIAIVDNEMCTHAEKLYNQNADEDDKWRELKYGLEDYCSAWQEKIKVEGKSGYTVEVKLFNDSSIDLFCESNGTEDYSLLYISNGLVVFDIIFDNPKNSLSDTTNVTIGMKNALEEAKSYLRYTSFSKTGLMRQLEFEKYTSAEAAYAVNNCGADWYAQAVSTAESYLRNSSFSKQGLYDQLIFEGFTKDEAEYGVSVAYK